MFKKLPGDRILFLISCLIVIILFISYLFRLCLLENRPAAILPKELQYGDLFPGKISLFSFTGKKLPLNDITKRGFNIIYYLNDADPDCNTRLISISRMIKLFNQANISYTILWQTKTPITKVKSMGIAPEINYSLQNRYTLGLSTPTAFIVDENGRIILISGYSYFALITKIDELCHNNDLRKTINEMMIRDVLHAKNLHIRAAKPYLLMFMTSGCERCRAADFVIKKNISLLQGKFNMISIRSDAKEKRSYDLNLVIDDSLIYFNLYNRFYGVKYPFFVILDHKAEVKRIFSGIDQLVVYTSKIP